MKISNTLVGVQQLPCDISPSQSPRSVVVRGGITESASTITLKSDDRTSAFARREATAPTGAIAVVGTDARDELRTGSPRGGSGRCSGTAVVLCGGCSSSVILCRGCSTALGSQSRAEEVTGTIIGGILSESTETSLSCRGWVSAQASGEATALSGAIGIGDAGIIGG